MGSMDASDAPRTAAPDTTDHAHSAVAIARGMSPGAASPTPGHRRVTEADLPFALRIASAWSWRLAIVLVVVTGLVWGLAQLSFLVVPVLVAALLAGLLRPAVAALVRARVPRGAAVA